MVIGLDNQGRSGTRADSPDCLEAAVGIGTLGAGAPAAEG